MAAILNRDQNLYRSQLKTYIPRFLSATFIKSIRCFTGYVANTTNKWTQRCGQKLKGCIMRYFANRDVGRSMKGLRWSREKWPSGEGELRDGGRLSRASVSDGPGGLWWGTTLPNKLLISSRDWSECESRVKGRATWTVCPRTAGAFWAISAHLRCPIIFLLW